VVEPFTATGPPRLPNDGSAFRRRPLERDGWPAWAGSGEALRATVGTWRRRLRRGIAFFPLATAPSATKPKSKPQCE